MSAEIENATFRDAAPLAVVSPMPPAQPARIDVDAAIAHASDFERLKAGVIDRGRHVNVIGGKDVVNAAGWAAIGTALGVGCEILSKTASGDPGARREVLKDAKDRTIVSYAVTIRATAPSGRPMDALGRCDSSETKHNQSEHKLEQVALTRAYAKGVARLVGGAQGVVAEEVDDDNHAAREAAPRAAQGVNAEEIKQLAVVAGMHTMGELIAWIANTASHEVPSVRDFDRRRPRELTPHESIQVARMLRELAARNAPPDTDEAPIADAPPRAPRKPTERQKGMLFALHEQHGHNDGDRHVIYMQTVGKTSFAELTAEDVATVIDRLTVRP